MCAVDVGKGRVVKLVKKCIIAMVLLPSPPGTAMDSLSGMHSFLTGRPQSFKSLEHAIEWR